jgi:hypothetical protein
MVEKCPLCKMDVENLKIHWRINHRKVKFSPGKVNTGFKGAKLIQRRETTSCPQCKEKVRNLDQHLLLVHPVRIQPELFHHHPPAQPGTSETLDHNLEFVKTVDSILERKSRTAGLRRRIRANYPFIPLYAGHLEQTGVKVEEDLEGEISRLDTDRLIKEIVVGMEMRERLLTYGLYFNFIPTSDTNCRKVRCPDCDVLMFQGPIVTKSLRNRLWKELRAHLKECSLDEDSMSKKRRPVISLARVKHAICEGDVELMEKYLKIYQYSDGLSTDQFFRIVRSVLRGIQKVPPKIEEFISRAESKPEPELMNMPDIEPEVMLEEPVIGDDLLPNRTRDTELELNKKAVLETALTRISGRSNSSSVPEQGSEKILFPRSESIGHFVELAPDADFILKEEVKLEPGLDPTG